MTKWVTTGCYGPGRFRTVVDPLCPPRPRPAAVRLDLIRQESRAQQRDCSAASVPTVASVPTGGWHQMRAGSCHEFFGLESLVGHEACDLVEGEAVGICVAAEHGERVGVAQL